jgi:hypothetical protein
VSEDATDHSVDRELDELIFANRKLDVIQMLRRQRRLDAKAATDAFASRYRQLRANFPDRFTCDDEEYWRGFYS